MIETMKTDVEPNLDHSEIERDLIIRAFEAAMEVLRKGGAESTFITLGFKHKTGSFKRGWRMYGPDGKDVLASTLKEFLNAKD